MYAHIARGIPNNWFTRKIVSLINKHLSAIDSIYRIKIRYRKPKVGGYIGQGIVHRDNAKAFSLYLRITNKERKRRYTMYGRYAHNIKY